MSRRARRNHTPAFKAKVALAADGDKALYRRPRTTSPEPGHKIYPCLLRGMEITRPNQVWAMDITYIPMARGFVYLAVVLDWATRRVPSWRLGASRQAGDILVAAVLVDGGNPAHDPQVRFPGE
jgi:transposase InsO family protein